MSQNTEFAVERPSGPFRLGDRVQLTGPKGRLHTITLRDGGELHTHHGVLKHTQLIGQPDGSVVANSGGHEYLALRPLLRTAAGRLWRDDLAYAERLCDLRERDRSPG